MQATKTFLTTSSSSYSFSAAVLGMMICNNKNINKPVSWPSLPIPTPNRPPPSSAGTAATLIEEDDDDDTNSGLMSPTIDLSVDVN